MTLNAVEPQREEDFAHSPVCPGSWIGMLGGGQLGRMFAHVAGRMGYHVAIFEPQIDCPAAQVAERHFCPSTNSASTESLIADMAQLCSVITLEFENIPPELLRIAGRTTRTRPSADFLEISQDRLREKRALSQAGFPTTPFRAALTVADVLAAAEELSWPLVLKTVRSGYDGKGQAVVRSADEVSKVLEQLGGGQLIAEKWIDFDSEVSMITARNASGQIESYPLFENSHVNHILDITRCPVSAHLRHVEQQAAEICRGIASNFGVLGLFCVEFFVTGSGDLLINEIAPRPHNSGHLTIEAFTCSQFEQQLRAVCNLPLVPPSMLRPAAMANLLGDLWLAGEPLWNTVLASSDANLHMYGKTEARKGRKMGHLTVLDESSSEAAITVRELRDTLIRPLL